jgi:hypothetical protein
LEELKKNFLDYVLELHNIIILYFWLEIWTKLLLHLILQIQQQLKNVELIPLPFVLQVTKKKNFTVILGCMADGTKLPPVCIFKRKTIPQENFPANVFVRANQKGWVDETEMLWWIENVWIKRVLSGNPNSLLILDSFSAHIVDSVKLQFSLIIQI